MAADPYQTLGVARTATADEIRRAYRKLAKQNHPDLHPGDKAAEDRFKAIASANDLLSDADKRARFDRGELDGAGEPNYASQGARGTRYPGTPFNAGESDVDYESMFADFLNRSGAGPQPQRSQAPRRGNDRTYSLDVDFLDAVNGATQRLSLPDGGMLEVRIPPGIDEGQTLRLKEKGNPGRRGGPPGDALIEVFIRPHKLFRREGSDITIELPITLAEAVLGAKVSVPTATGPVNLSIPPNATDGAKLRLRGRGVPAHGTRLAGDQYVILKLLLDPKDAGLATFLRDRTDAPVFNPRADLKSPGRNGS